MCHKLRQHYPALLPSRQAPHLLQGQTAGDTAAACGARAGGAPNDDDGRDENKQGWSIIFYDSLPTDTQVDQSDVVVVINPNNPSGQFHSRDKLLKLRDKLATHNGTLIIDEAFVDVTPQSSVLNPLEQLNYLIVLRSVGKFFGLAGARVGFVFAKSEIKEHLEEYLGPWTVAGPSRWLLKQALSDKQWQQRNRERIKQASARLEKLLMDYLPFTMVGSDLFKTVYIDNAPMFHESLCKEQVLTRLCDEKNAIRFGLPANEIQWQKLATVLCKLSKVKGNR